MNLPNQLTLLRILMTFLLMGLLFVPGGAAKAMALILFLLCCLTDYLDGRIARARGLVSDFGKIMEKLMVLNGQASSRDAHMGLNINVNDPAGITMEMLRDLASAARSAGADTRPAPTSPLPRSDGARQVN